MKNFIFEREIHEGNFHGTTPPIDGEYFTIKRGYKLTVKDISKIFQVSESCASICDEYLQKYLYNSPSVIIYTIFNEGWGQFKADENYKIAKKNDPTRLYDSTSGWFQQKKSDFNSFHLYFDNIKKIPNIKKRPIFISEFGGFAYIDKEHIYSEDSFGYDTFESLDDLYNGLKALI